MRMFVLKKTVLTVVGLVVMANVQVCRSMNFGDLLGDLDSVPETAKEYLKNQDPETKRRAEEWLEDTEGLQEEMQYIAANRFKDKDDSREFKKNSACVAISLLEQYYGCLDSNEEENNCDKALFTSFAKVGDREMAKRLINLLKLYQLQKARPLIIQELEQEFKKEENKLLEEFEK